MNIYVGNLSFQVTEEEVRKAFEAHGEVGSVKIVKDNYSGQSKGFGFVEMSQQDQGTAAMKALDGQPFQGRNLKVNEARPKTDKPRGERW